MNKENLIAYFEKKRAEIPALRQVADMDDSVEFKKWWDSIKNTMQRMGGNYADRPMRISFWSSVVTMGYRDLAADREAYLGGLNDAESMLDSTIEELETWGYEGPASEHRTSRKAESRTQVVNVHVAMSQEQAQAISQKIDIQQYPQDIQDKVKELFEELEKKDKDKSKIRDVIKYIADKGVDTLIAILVAKAHL